MVNGAARPAAFERTLELGCADLHRRSGGLTGTEDFDGAAAGAQGARPTFYWKTGNQSLNSALAGTASASRTSQFGDIREAFSGAGFNRLFNLRLSDMEAVTNDLIARCQACRRAVLQYISHRI